MSLTIDKQSTSPINCSNSKNVSFGMDPELNLCYWTSYERKQSSVEKIVKLQQIGVTDMITRLKARGAGENYLIEPQLKTIN